jgi:hypothetical protein
MCLSRASGLACIAQDWLISATTELTAASSAGRNAWELGEQLHPLQQPLETAFTSLFDMLILRVVVSALELRSKGWLALLLPC